VTAVDRMRAGCDGMWTGCELVISVCGADVSWLDLSVGRM
jgi:hypothetical protein